MVKRFMHSALTIGACVLAAVGIGAFCGALWLVQALSRPLASRPALSWSASATSTLRDPCATLGAGITVDTLLHAVAAPGDRAANVAAVIRCIGRADDRAVVFRALHDRAVRGGDAAARAAFEDVARAVCADLDAITDAASGIARARQWSCTDVLVAGIMPNVFSVASDERAELARFAELAALVGIGIVHPAITAAFCVDPVRVTERALQLGWSDLPDRARAYCAANGSTTPDAGVGIP